MFGFTLVELIVVMAILSILASAGLTIMDPAGKKARARDSVRKKDMAVLSEAVEAYYAANDEYPSALSSLTGSPKYINNIPTDPYPGPAYCYNRVDSQNFVVCAAKENGGDELNGASSTCISSLGSRTGSYCLTNPF